MRIGLLHGIFFFCVLSATSTAVIGVLVLKIFLQKEQNRTDALFFDQAGLCSVLYFSCTAPTITLFVGGISKAVKVWDEIHPRYFCGIPSSSYIPCMWSWNPRFSGYVRMGPAPPETFSLFHIALVLMVVSLVVIFGVAILLLCGRRDQMRTLCCWLCGNLGRRETAGAEEMQEVDMESLLAIPQGQILQEVYPMSVDNWWEEVACEDEYAKRRLEILIRYFAANRKRAEQVVRHTEPYISSFEGDMSEEYDDEDIPVNECYVCLSTFRRRIIWWPCGHWMCSNCSRKILRLSPMRGFCWCPGCRASFRHEQLLILHLVPRSTNIEISLPVQNINDA